MAKTVLAGAMLGTRPIINIEDGSAIIIEDGQKIPHNKYNLSLRAHTRLRVAFRSVHLSGE